MRSTAHPVTVVIAKEKLQSSADDQSLHMYRGLLVSSFNTVTLRPKPYVSFNLRLPSSTYDAICQSRTFTASGITNAVVADSFVKARDNGKAWEQFLGKNGRLKEGLGGTWWMRCAWEQERSVQVEDHVVIIAEVISAGTYTDWNGQPGLIYAEGKYRWVGHAVDHQS